VLVLRGTNFPGYEYGDWSHTEADYGKIARLGLNVVRLPIAWAMLEPKPGRFDSAYLSHHVDRDIKWAKKYGLYIILDMHQWYWSNRFNDGYGNGMPSWTVAQYAPTLDGMKEAVADFWVSDTLQTRLADVWQKVAKIYANETSIVGYDLFNEPPVYASVASDLSASNVYSFYVKMIRAIRQVDSNHVIFLEPCWGVQSCYRAPSEFPIRDKVVWSPHFYPLSWASSYSPQDVAVLKADLATKYENCMVQTGTPMWIGEFGAYMDAKSSEYWLQDATGLFNNIQVGWALWPAQNSVQTIPSSLSPAD
jgi:aryl-phospho-beta-D-glucosidase BglC (GH1 family)